MRVIYVSNLCLPEIYESLFEDSSHKSSEAAQKYHRIFAEGFADNGCEVISLGVVPINRNARKKLILLRRGNLKGVTYKHLFTVNIRGLKQFLNALGVFFYVLLSGDKKESFVICDALSFLASKAAVLACRIKKIKSVGIITDFPEYFDNVGKKEVCKYNKLFREFSNYVLLTKAMEKKLGVKEQECVIIEGQVDIREKFDVFQKEVRTPKIVMYAGSVQSKYGLKMLVEGFIKAGLEGYELHIYGNGDYTEEIKKLSLINASIKYQSSQPNDIIVKREKEAYLLVNPRPSNEEYTKYSFPSKNMEYMVSGTAVLTTKLPGMPEEYGEYLYLIEEESAEGVSKALRKIAEVPEKEILEMGRRAREFVLYNKSNKKQAEKVLEMIREIL